MTADLKAKPWSKKWQLSTATIAKCEKQLDQGKDRESRAQERLQKAKDEVLASQANIAQIQGELEKATEAHHALLAVKEESGGMECDEDSAASSLEKVTKGIRPELLQSQEAVQALQTLQQVILENQKAEEASKGEKVPVSEPDGKVSPSEHEETDRLWESLLKPGRMEKVQKMWEKLQSKKVEQTASEAVPEGGDAADMADSDTGFSKSLERSLVAQTSKSHRFQPYSG